MSDFWNQLDVPYRFFSQFCDTEDWQLILRALGGAIVHRNRAKGGPISILDVGCGNGAATQTVCEIVFANTRCFPLLHVVEPSGIARDRLLANVLKADNNGPLKGVCESIEQLPSKKFDAIVFLHSTYYLGRSQQWLPNLVKTHLHESGAVYVVALPEGSPFFLGKQPLTGCSDEVEKAMQVAKLRTTSYTLRSKFRVPSGGLSQEEWSLIRQFMAPSTESPDVKSFQSEVKKHAPEGVLDFQDHLVVGEWRAS